MLVLHEIDPKKVQKVMSEGIRCGSQGLKTDRLIKKTDEYLDKHIPEFLSIKGVSRSASIYAYIMISNFVIDIENGKEIGIEQFIKNSQQATLFLEIDPLWCYVSDLDLYDAVKNGIKNNSKDIDSMAGSYWESLIRLDEFQFEAIRRPEVMIPHDLPPHSIRMPTVNI